jgi:hypothetical protein
MKNRLNCSETREHYIEQNIKEDLESANKGEEMMVAVSKENDYREEVADTCKYCESFGKHFNRGSIKKCEIIDRAYEEI